MTMESKLTLPQAGVPFSQPLAQPEAGAKPAPARENTPEQQAVVTKLIAHFNAPEFTLPNTLDALRTIWRKRDGSSGRSLFGWGSAPKDVVGELAPLSEVEKCYWSLQVRFGDLSTRPAAPAQGRAVSLLFADDLPLCPLQAFERCFRAVKWDYDAAVKRAEVTCVWRREYGVEEMKPEHVSPEGETGKEIVFGYDRDSRPVLYMHPYRQNTETGPRQIDFVIWCLEVSSKRRAPSEVRLESHLADFEPSTAHY